MSPDRLPNCVTSSAMSELKIPARRLDIQICFVLLTALIISALTAVTIDAAPPATEQQSARPLAVSPVSVTFRDAWDRTQLLVSAAGHDETSAAHYETSDADIVEIDNRGLLIPRGRGKAVVTVRVGDASQPVSVDVSDWLPQRHVDFATEVVPLLSKFGCNAGGCHGKSTGKNGFKLSLFGFDTEFDYAALVNEARGRRVFLSAPRDSLLLTKAVAQVPHGGGKRFEIDSEPYRIIESWIRQGASASSPDAPHITSVRIEPEQTILAANQRQQLRLTAVYSDGSERDVTRQAEYSSNVDVVARVDERGLVFAGTQSGEAAIMARYMGNVAVFRALRPHGPSLNELPEFEPLTEVDRLAAKRWMQLGLRPSAPAEDATILRRLTIDLCGRLPTVEETRAFLEDTSPAKRVKVIDRLLDSPDYPAYFALKWSAILRNSRLAGADQAAYAFHNWIRDMIARNRPYDEFVRGIVAASGEWQDAPAINWYWQSRDDQLHTVTADTAQLFLGLRLQCARCHHHPYERWTQEDYFGLAGFFSRVGRKSFGQPPPYYSAGQRTTGEKNPVTGKPIEPKYPDGEYATFTPEQDPRHGLVDWMAQPDNPFFAKAFVNRMWAHFFGRGLVNEADDLRETNPASNPEILDWLANEFVDSKFDMKHIIRLIVSSRMYQLSADPRPENEADTQNFARFYARRMIAEVFLDAVDQACGTRSNFNNMSRTARAVDLPHEGFGSFFLDTFDRPQRVSVCECERSPGATLAQVLLLANSDEVENKLAAGDGRIARLINEKKPIPAIVDELYSATFNRLPTDAERARAVEHLEKAEDQRKAAEDLLWSLLNSREFMFNH
ncbi:DUF1553 domain-containing protein [bacterium]|nr:DUF1553 domain-containing protein [bacterium]